MEADGSLYVPELAAKQAVNTFDQYPHFYKGGENYYTRIAYINSKGEHEAVLLLGEKEKNAPLLSPAKPCISGEIYDEEYYSNEYYLNFDLFSENFKIKMIESYFDTYIPNGLCTS